MGREKEGDKDLDQEQQQERKYKVERREVGDGEKREDRG